MKTIKSPGQRAYEAYWYCRNISTVALTGQTPKMNGWVQASPEEKTAWEAAAKEVLRKPKTLGQIAFEACCSEGALGGARWKACNEKELWEGAAAAVEKAVIKRRKNLHD